MAELVRAICENPKCFREFIKFKGNQRYCCSACQKQAKSLREREQTKSARQKIINTNGRKPRTSLAESNALARAEGLTYGQYYNKHGYDGWF